MSASNVAPEVTFFVIGFININKYTFASENVHLCFKKTVNWVTLVSLLVEYLLYSVIPVLDFPGLDTVEQRCSLTVYYGSILDRND